jgi:hypothetical protein
MFVVQKGWEEWICELLRWRSRQCCFRRWRPHPDYPIASTEHTAYVAVMQMCIEPLWDRWLHCGAIRIQNIFKGLSSPKPGRAGREPQVQLCHLFGSLLEKLWHRMHPEVMLSTEVLFRIQMRLPAPSYHWSMRIELLHGHKPRAENPHKRQHNHE